MAETGIPFDGQTIAEDEFAEIWKHLMPDGVILSTSLAATPLDSLLVYGDSSGRQVKVKAGEGIVNARKYKNDAEKIVSLATNTSGDPRIDRIVLRLVKSTKSINLAVLQGTPAAIPTAPALTQSSTTYEVSLARVAIANGYTTVAAADVTDERPVSSGTHGGTGALVKLSQQTVSVDTAALRIYNVPPSFTDLVIRLSVRSTASVAETLMGMHLNLVTGTDYDSQEIAVNHNTFSGNRTTNTTAARLGTVMGASASDPYNWANVELVIFDYASSTKRKGLLSTAGYDVGDTPVVEQQYSTFDYQSPVSIVDVTLAAGSFKAGSDMTIYGRR